MAIVPTKINDLLEFASIHSSLWAQSPTAYGLTAAQCTALTNAVNAATGAYSDALDANQAKIKATGTSNQKISALRTSLAETISFIKAYAETQADPAQIFINAQLPPPAPPAPAPAPATPTDVKVGVRLTDGAVELKWKASNPTVTGGVTYVIRRRFGSVGPFQYAGLAGSEKTFVDETLPRGVDFVNYTITGTRSGVSGQPCEIAVRFGTVGPGGALNVVSVTENSTAASPKLAA